MADLEAAAEVALVKVKEFGTDVDQAHAVLAALEEKVASVSAQLESDWTELEERAESFLEAARAQKARLAQDGQEAASALDTLEEAAARAEAEASAEVEDTRQQLAELATEVQSDRPAVAGMVDTLEAAARGLAARAAQVEQQLVEALNEARDFLAVEVVTELTELRTEAEQRIQATHEAMATDCETALDDKFGEWESKLQEVLELAEQQGFEDAQEHATDLVDLAVQECAARVDEVLDELEPLARDLAEGLDKLAGAVDDHRGEVGGDMDAHEQGLLDTHSRLAAVLAALRQVTERLKSFSFVGM